MPHSRSGLPRSPTRSHLRPLAFLHLSFRRQALLAAAGPVRRTICGSRRPFRQHALVSEPMPPDSVDNRTALHRPAMHRDSAAWAGAGRGEHVQGTPLPTISRIFLWHHTTPALSLLRLAATSAQTGRIHLHTARCALVRPARCAMVRADWSSAGGHGDCGWHPTAFPPSASQLRQHAARRRRCGGARRARGWRVALLASSTEAVSGDSLQSVVVRLRSLVTGMHLAADHRRPLKPSAHPVQIAASAIFIGRSFVLASLSCRPVPIPPVHVLCPPPPRLADSPQLRAVLLGVGVAVGRSCFAAALTAFEDRNAVRAAAGTCCCAPLLASRADDNRFVRVDVQSLRTEPRGSRRHCLGFRRRCRRCSCVRLRPKKGAVR